MHARDGDHLMIPFECDTCIFIKLRHHYPNHNIQSDKLLLQCIRRMNLDAFWSRESSTVISNKRKAKKMLEASRLVGLEGPFKYSSSFPTFDHCGYEVAIIILLLSRKPGKHSNQYLQYDTIRGFRSTFSNYVKASPDNNLESLSLGDFTGNYMRLLKDECGSLFFKRFMEGLKSRMGQITKSNLALSLDLLIKAISIIETKIVVEDDNETSHLWRVFLVYVVLSYSLSLRGPEGFLIDLTGLNQHWKDDRNYLIISLFGRIKGEKYDLTHLIPCTTATTSGIQLKQILKEFIIHQRHLGRTKGPAITDINGKLLSTKVLDEMFHEVLNLIYSTEKHLFPTTIKSSEDIKVYYQCYRTFRKTFTTRATEMGVSREDINVVNRWKAEENAKGKRPNFGMHQHYTQLELLVAPFIRYTRSM